MIPYSGMKTKNYERIIISEKEINESFVGSIELEDVAHYVKDEGEALQKQFFAGFCESIHKKDSPILVLGYKKIAKSEAISTTMYLFNNKPGDNASVYIMGNGLGLLCTGMRLDCHGDCLIPMKGDVYTVITPIQYRRDKLPLKEYIEQQKIIFGEITEPRQKIVYEQLKEEKQEIILAEACAFGKS